MRRQLGCSLSYFKYQDNFRCITILLKYDVHSRSAVVRAGMLTCSSIFLLSALVTSSFSWLPSTFKGSRVWRPSSNDQKRSLASFRSKFGYRNLMEKRSPVNPASLFRRQSRLVEIFGMQLSEKCVKECCEKQQRDSSQGCSVSYF